MAARNRELEALITLAGKIDPSLKKALQDTTKQTKTLKEKLGDAGKGIGKVFKGVGKVVAVTGAAIAAGVTAAGAATAKMLRDTLDYAGEIDDMAVRTGISRNELQKLKYITGQVGVEFGNVQTAITLMTKNMANATDEGKAAERGLSALGISARDANGNLRDQSEVFQEAVAMLSAVENESQRAVLAQDIFGKQAVELAPLFEEGTESLAAMAREAENLGLVMSDDDIMNTAALDDKFNKIKDTAAGFGRGLISTILPQIEGITDMVMSKLPQIQSMVGGLFSRIGPLLVNMLPQMLEIGDALTPLVGLFFELAAEAGPILFDTLRTIMEALKPIIPVIMDAAKEFKPLITQMIQLATEAIMPLIKALAPLIENIMPVFINLFSSLLPILEILTPVISFLADVIGFVLGGMLQRAAADIAWFSDLFESIRGVFIKVVDTLKNVFGSSWEEVWANVGSVFSGIWDGIKRTFNDVLTWIITGINKLIGGANTIVGAVGGVLGFDWEISEIPLPQYAKGGIATRPSIFGEAGPEMAIPLQRTPRSLSLLSETAQRLGVQGVGSSPTFVYSPTISGGSTAENRQLLSESQADFKARMDRWWREKGRPAYGL